MDLDFSYDRYFLVTFRYTGSGKSVLKTCFKIF